MFWLELEISQVAVQGIHQKQQKMAAFSEDFLTEGDFKAALWLYGAKFSEEVEKITTDQKYYNKSSLGVNTNSPSIDNSKKRVITRTPPA